MDLKAIANKALERINGRTVVRTNTEQEAVRSVPVLFGKSFIEKDGGKTALHTNVEAENDKNLQKPLFGKTFVESASSWHAEDKLLIDWFMSTPNLTKKPFVLKQAVFVSDPEKYYFSLRCDIADGPKAPRARYGAVQNDLRCLKLRVESGGLYDNPP